MREHTCVHFLLAFCTGGFLRQKRKSCLALSLGKKTIPIPTETIRPTTDLLPLPQREIVES